MSGEQGGLKSLDLKRTQEQVILPFQKKPPAS